MSNYVIALHLIGKKFLFLSFEASFGRCTLSLSTQVLVDPVSKRALINYGGFPTYISDT
jgi:hypothetical protein